MRVTKATDLFTVEELPNRTRSIEYPLDFFPPLMTAEEEGEGHDYITVPLSVSLSDAEERAEELLEYVINDDKTPIVGSLEQAYKKLGIKDGDIVLKYKSGLFKNPKNYLVMPKTKTKCGIAYLGTRYDFGCVRLGGILQSKLRRKAKS